MTLKEFVCFMFGHKWAETYACYRVPSKSIRRSSILNRKGGKKRTLLINSFKIKREKVCYCERCGKIKK